MRGPAKGKEDVRLNKRRHQRVSMNMGLRFSVIGSHAGNNDIGVHGRSGTVVDVSEIGIGVITDAPLNAGLLVKFEGIDPETGIVVWAGPSGEKYRAGIRFL